VVRERLGVSLFPGRGQGRTGAGAMPSLVRSLVRGSVVGRSLTTGGRGQGTGARAIAKKSGGARRNKTPPFFGRSLSAGAARASNGIEPKTPIYLMPYIALEQASAHRIWLRGTPRKRPGCVAFRSFVSIFDTAGVVFLVFVLS